LQINFGEDSEKPNQGGGKGNQSAGNSPW